MEWFEVEEKTRIKDFYSKYKIKDFWDWWSGGQAKVIEVRIRDYNLIKQVVNKYGFPYSSSGVYVKTAQELKTVIAAVRDKATVWIGVNPRKRNWSGRKFKVWGSGSRQGSSDDNIESIDFIFIDIDRKVKDGPASNKELENCNILAEKIVEGSKMTDWDKSYAKIASGNGIQLLFKLDVPILIPNRVYNNEKKYFENNEEFDKLKKLVKNAIGTPLSRFCKRFTDELIVEPDLSAFNLNRVSALCATKNFKYDSFTWRGIIKLETSGTNEGLSDYLLSKINDIKTFKSTNLFVKSRTVSHKNLIKPGKLREHPIVKLFIENDLPGGELNNKLWFSLKCLLRDLAFNINSDEFREFHKELEAKYRGRFTTNLPTKQFSFDENVVNSFCINNGIAPIYKLWSHRTKKINMKLEEIQWGIQVMTPEAMKLDSVSSIQEDLKTVKEKLVLDDYDNINVIARFINGCIKKYGETKTKYFVEYLFDRYFNYS